MMVHLILVLFSLLAVNAGGSVTTTSSYSVDESSTFHPSCPAVYVRRYEQSLHVEWDFTCYIVANETEYEVSVIPLRPKICEEDSEVPMTNISTGDSEIMVSDLAPYYDYQVNVTMNTYSAVAVASALEDDPPRPYVFVRGDNRRLHVQWNITGCTSAIVTGYTVSAIPQGPKGIGCEKDKEVRSANISAEESETMISNLAPYYDYQVNVTVHTESGKQATGVAFASTSEDDIPSPKVSAIGDKRSLQVRWNSCIAANVTGYTVSVVPRGPKGVDCAEDEDDHLSDVSAGESEITVSHLAPYYDYQVIVTVNTGSGEHKSGVAEASTLEDDLPAPVVWVRGDNRSLHVQWNIAGCKAAEVTGYTVSVIPRGPKGVGCNVTEEIHTRNVSTEVSEVTISGLAPYYNYQVNVTVKAKNGKEATGVGHATTSEDDLPVPVVWVRGDNRSLHVQWNTNDCIAAEVTGYTVSVIPEGPKGVRCKEVEGIHSRNVSTELSEVTISGLAPYYDYQVNVTLKAESGKEATGVGYATTSEDDLPDLVVWVRGDNRSLHIQWNTTDCIAAEVTGYTVSAIPEGPKGEGCNETEEIHSRNVSTIESEVTISGLAPYYDYQVNVTLKAGSGKEATGVGHATTSEDDLPDLVVWVRGDNRSLHIQWNTTDCIAAEVTGYTVSAIPEGPKGEGCNETEEIHSRNVSTIESEVTISDLAPYYDYQVNVTLKAESGKQATGVGHATTSEDDLPAPLVWVRGDNRSLHVQWNITGCKAAEITGYTVSVIPEGPRGEGCKEVKGIHTRNASTIESEVTISGLEPYYDYQVNVTVNAESGKEATGVGYATTSEDVPPPPREIKSKGYSLYITVEWKMEGCVNGKVLNFTISLFLDGYLDKNECNKVFENRSEVIEVMHKKFEDVEPYSTYTVQIAASTAAGLGPPLTLKINTTPRGSEPVTNLHAVDLNPTNATVSWEKPCRLNGESLKHYKVSFIGTRKDFEHHKHDTTVKTENIFLTSLRPEYSYTVTVIAQNGNDVDGEPNNTTFNLPADIPRQWRSLEEPDPYATDDSTTKAKFTFYRDMFNASDGYVLFYAILLAENAMEPESGHLVPGQECHQWTKPESTHQATPLCWNPFPTRTTTKNGMTISYVLGANASCSSDYCNKPLTPGSRYYVTVRVFTKSTYADAKYVTLDTGVSGVKKTRLKQLGPAERTDGRTDWTKLVSNSSVNVGLVVGVVLSLLLLGCCILISVLYRRRSLSWSGAKAKGEMAGEDNGSSPLIRRGGKRVNQRRGSRRKYRRLKPPRDAPEYEVSNWHRVPPDERSLDFCPQVDQQLSESGESDFTVRSAPLRYHTKSSESDIDILAESESSLLLRQRQQQQQEQKADRCPQRCASEHCSDRCALSFSPMDSEDHIPPYVGSEDAFKTPPQRPPKMLLLRRQLEAQPKPVSLTRFPAYSDYMLGVPTRISNEYHMLQTFSKDITETESCCAALQPENRRKNRYCNILPFDSTRVVLEPLPDDPSSDYINASFIRGYSREVEYIATQGPKEETCFDFWRMVYQHGVKIIIMLTNLQECDKVKCYEYFPSLREHVVFGDITIRCTTELVFPIYTSRTFQLLKDNTQRSIVHLHFREWPDFGCPTNPDMLLQFSQAVRHQITLMKPCLTVVHCSAGVGRTGTLITIDILLQHIKEHKKVDIFGTVFNLRRQRMFMVQSESQYVHIYHCLKAALTDPKFLESAHLIDICTLSGCGSEESGSSIQDS